MPERAQQKRRADPTSRLITAALYLIVGFSFLAFCDRNSYQQLAGSWVAHLLLVALSILLYLRCPPRGVYLLGPAILLWMLITTLAKEPFPQTLLPGRTHFSEQCAVFCIALPFSRFIGAAGRRHLNRILLVIVLLMACMIWLCLTGTFTGQTITLFHNGLSFGARYTETGRLKLRVLNLHYYHLGYLSVLCFFITLYFAAAKPARRWRPVWILLLLTFAASTLMTYSRNAVFALLFGLLAALYLLLQKLCRQKSLRIVIFCCCAAGGLLLTCAGMNLIYRAVHSIRDVWYGLSTLSSRTEIWSGGIRALLSHPQAILLGFPPDTGMETINRFIQPESHISHMHSGFMEMLVSFGLPGLILLAVLCVIILKRCCRLFFSSPEMGISPGNRMLSLIPVLVMQMNLFDCLFPFQRRLPVLIPLICALVSGCIVESCRGCGLQDSACHQPNFSC